MSTLTKTIEENECLTGSLQTINTNFAALNNEACTLKQQIENNKQIRTFFYYGDMQDGTASKPSNLTIEIFVNSPSQLNIPSISYTGDIVYVIYQKTGFRAIETQENQTVTTGNYTPENIPSAIEGKDLSTRFAPIFIIWRLTYNGTEYKVDVGFPKYSQASTSATGVFQPGWNDPRQWTTY